MNNSVLLKEDLIKIVQDAKKNSCVTDRIPVYGETYVSKETKERKKKNSRVKQGIKCILASAAVSGVLIGGVVLSDTIDFATEIQEEVNDTYMSQNAIGGKYEERSEHGTDFRNYVNDLNAIELASLFNETSEQMQNDDMVGFNSMENVVDQMEENYLEDIGKSK